MVTDTGRGTGSSLDDLVRSAHRVATAIESVIEGKAEAVRLALTVLLAEGHVLIEDVPGVGKTMLAKALARSTDCSVRRIQFTPDLLPSDITGVSAFNQERREFEFKPGPVFANIVVGDEINRASPEDPVRAARMHGGAAGHGGRHDLPAGPAVHGDRHPEPDRDGGDLPAARGAAGPVHRPHLHGLPERRGRTGDARRCTARRPRWTRWNRSPAPSDMRELIAAVRTVHVAERLKQYVISLVSATRSTPELRLGASPRATLHLLRASRARAALDGRDFVIPDDVQALACRCSPTGCCRPPRPWSPASCRSGCWPPSSGRLPLPQFR